MARGRTQTDSRYTDTKDLNRTELSVRTLGLALRSWQALDPGVLGMPSGGQLVVSVARRLRATQVSVSPFA